ncbi:hypothetical protein TNCV_4011331 [Trichonephila clavipes]|nr:hypothetical protein TNCV_4011331 [Trichonephila clavipes]
MNKITDLIPNKVINVDVNISELVPLADPSFNVPDKIDMLLVAEVSGPLYASELQQAKIGLIRMVQTEIFSAENRAFQSQKGVLSNIKLKALNPFLDVGVLRVAGR